MKLTITINMNNAAFDPHPEFEAARILKAYAATITNETSLLVGDSRPLRDYNGNVVGTAKITE